MGLPALLFPSSADASGSSPHGQADVLGLPPPVRALIDGARSSRFGDSSVAETQALVRFVEIVVGSVTGATESELDSLRRSLDDRLSQLLRRELETAEPQRKLALRQIEKALDVYGVLIESFAAALGSVSGRSLALIADEATDSGHVEARLADQRVRTVIRFQFNVVVALDVLDAPLDELTFWAFRVLNDARRVAAIPGSPTVGFRGELARIRAKHSWDDWDDEEIAREIAPWPARS